MVQLKLVATGDGSHTLYNSMLNEHYHSTNGAVNEALHIFIKHGLEYHAGSPCTLLEIGFGTGLNALLTYRYALQKSVVVNYHGIELYPLDSAIIQNLNYSRLSESSYAPLFKAIHGVEWNVPARLDAMFLLHKIAGDIHTHLFQNTFDVVYFDAFAPDKQPDMWTQAVFDKIYGLVNPGGVLVTYCAKGSVKRALKSAGFIIERLPGPPGKREMTRAVKMV